jgi:ferredoxin
MPTDYNGYKIQCLRVGSKFDGFKYRYNNRRSSNSTTRQEKLTEKVVTHAAVDNSASMNWEPTQATKVFKLTDPHLSAQLTKDNKRLKGKRAKWVFNDEFKAKFREKRCIRCGRTYCKKEICPLKALIRPEFTIKANKAIPVMEASVNIEDTDEGDF